MKSYDVSRLPSMIELGFDGENNWRPNSFDCSALLKNHPDGVLSLWLLPKGESQAFPVAVDRDGNNIIWTPLNEEMTTEDGFLQVVCVDGSSVGKSDTAQYHVKGSLVPGAEHPSETPSWAARVMEATGHYPKIENGNWYVWDVQNGEWADTGVSAGGDVSPEQIESAVEDYLDEHPITVTETDPTVPVWAKQPDKPTYTANEVGALPADTPIPAAVTEQTVAGWGFTKNAGTYSKPSGGIPDSDIASAADWNAKGTYSKPSGGIPKTDLADDVQTSLGKADTAYQKPSGGIPKTDLASDVQTSLGKADTALQEHQSLAGYTTETYVQQQIDAIPDELPAVSAADNGKFLRVVSGAWAAETVQTWQGGSY